MMVRSLVQNAVPISATYATIGDKEFVFLEPTEYELVKQRLRCHEILLALIGAIVPDINERISSIKSHELQDALDSINRESDTKLKGANIIPSKKLVRRAKRRLKEGKYFSFTDFGKRIGVEDIKLARKQAGLTQEQLAKKARLLQPQVSKLEKDPKSASTATLRKVAAVLGVELII